MALLSTEAIDQLDQKFEDYGVTIKEMIAEKTEGNAPKFAELRTKLEKIDTDISGNIREIHAAQAKHAEDLKKSAARILELEQKGSAPLHTDPAAMANAMKTIGQRFIESDTYAASVKAGHPGNSIGKVKLGSVMGYEGLSPWRPYSTAIVNATGLNQPLVEEDRVAGIFIDPGQRLMTIRDLIPVQRTVSNMITFVRENVFTNAAAPQGAGSSPQVSENVAKAESAMTFELLNEAVQTLAHWIPASRQVLDDSPMLRGHIDQRLMFGLKLVEEAQLLNGSGEGVNLHGLTTQATAYDAPGLNVANDTFIDQLRHAIFQVVRDGEYLADGMVLNHADWHTIELLKVNPGTDDRYVFSDPQGKVAPRMWGLRVVATNSQTAGDFLVGAFALAATIWDRSDATVEVFRQHEDFAIKNMVAILVEERLALTVYRPLALVTGTFV